ncbi:MAG: cytochrome c3 family protein [bacterium]
MKPKIRRVQSFRRGAIRPPLMLLILGLLVILGGVPPAVSAEGDSCVWCHQRPELKVTNKKLYDYYLRWSLSVHAQERITCSECHGGNPATRDKEAAHGAKPIGASEQASPVHYRNIPKTCAQCHEEFFDQYRLSNHFRHLTGKDQEQGPNCVTCHASVSTTVLNVNTVRATCELCHNEKTGNHPDIPDKAERLLADFLSIQRFSRFLALKGGLLPDRAAVQSIEEQTDHLFVEWHTFDLAAIERRTAELLTLLKKKRDEIRKR